MGGSRKVLTVSMSGLPNNSKWDAFMWAGKFCLVLPKCSLQSNGSNNMSEVFNWL